MKLIHISEKECYGRRVKVYSAVGKCDYCNEEKKILSVDTSGDEYCNFDCCLTCFTKLLEQENELC